LTKRKTPPLPAAEAAALEERRSRQRAFFADEQAVRDCMEELAEGVTLKAWSESRRFSASTVRHHLATHHPAAYEAIRTVVADGVLDEISELEAALSSLLKEPPEVIQRDTASFYRELLKSKQWRVEKLNPARYGQRQNIDMRVTDTGRMQLDAIRSLTRQRRAERLAAPDPAPSTIVLRRLNGPAQTALPAMPSLSDVTDRQGLTYVTDGVYETVQPDVTVVPVVPAKPDGPTVTVVPAMPAMTVGPTVAAGPVVTGEAGAGAVWTTSQGTPGAPAQPSRARTFVLPARL
jgi:hypothetical protein